MHTFTKLSLAAAALTLVACGPKAQIGGGKQGAADALFAASAPTKGSTDPNASGVDTIHGDVTVKCRYGGDAQLKNWTLSVDTTTGATNVSNKFTLFYNQCGAAQSEAGIATYNGSFDVTQHVATTTTTGGATAMVSQTFKGKVTVDGAFSDFIDADISEDVDASSLNGMASATVKLVGKLTDASGSYDYNENVSVSSGNLSVQATKN